MPKVLEVIWGVRKQKYFCKEDWTASINLIRFNKFAGARKSAHGGESKFRFVSRMEISPSFRGTLRSIRGTTRTGRAEQSPGDGEKGKFSQVMQRPG